ncbi:MAG: DUF4367 domain-containing protein [Clostridia bacterium]|nr:DUF4367 domain-containing protein [Clostridia bacterium]
MKDTQSTDNLKKAFENIALPPIDVRQDVMQRIYNRKEVKPMFNKKKLLIITVLAVVLLVSAGFGAMKIWDLQGPGNSPYTYQLFDRGDTLPPDLFRDDYEKLAPAEALAIIKVKDNDKHAINLRIKPKSVKSLYELSSIIGNGFQTPSAVPEGYSFKEGNIGYRYDESYAKEMIEESKNTDLKYIKRVLKPTDQISDFTLVYSNNKNEITVSTIFNYPSKDIQDIENGQKVNKVKVNNFDAVYVENNGSGQIVWLKNNQGNMTYYCIRSLLLDQDTKDHLLKIAGSLN